MFWLTRPAKYLTLRWRHLSSDVEMIIKRGSLSTLTICLNFGSRAKGFAVRIEGAILRRGPCLTTERCLPRVPDIDAFDNRTISASSRTASIFNSSERSIIDSPTSGHKWVLQKIALVSVLQQTQWTGRFLWISCFIQCSGGFVLFQCFVENNVTLFCYSNLSFSARKETGHEWSVPPLIGTPIYGLISSVSHLFFWWTT